LIKIRVGFNQSTRCFRCVLFPRTYSWLSRLEGAWTQWPLVAVELSSQMSQTIRVGSRPSTHGCRTVRDAQDMEHCSALVDHACSPAPPVLLVLLLSGASRVTTPCDIFDMRGLPMVMSLPLYLSTTSDQTKTFYPLALLY
jgi:hypothetical protein